jgi:hypothetical protein
MSFKAIPVAIHVYNRPCMEPLPGHVPESMPYHNLRPLLGQTAWPPPGQTAWSLQGLSLDVMPHHGNWSLPGLSSEVMPHHGNWSLPGLSSEVMTHHGNWPLPGLTSEVMPHHGNWSLPGHTDEPLQGFSLESTRNHCTGPLMNQGSGSSPCLPFRSFSDQTSWLLSGHAVRPPENRITSDLTKFLLKKDLLLTRFTSFNDRPESLSLWKQSFNVIFLEQEVSSLE